jgi:response regulator NasT
MKITLTNTQKTKKSLLLVDDDRLILSTLSSGLVSAGYDVDTVESVDEAEHWLDSNERPDMVIVDVRMPGRYGLELIDKLNEMDNLPFILLTAFNDDDIIEKAKNTGAMGYLVKPIDVPQMIPTIETAISRAEELQVLRKAKVNLQTALDGERAISVAVGIIMGQQHLNHDEAFETIRKSARSNHLKLADLATNIVKARETLNLNPKATPQISR